MGYCFNATSKKARRSSQISTSVRAALPGQSTGRLRCQVGIQDTSGTFDGPLYSIYENLHLKTSSFTWFYHTAARHTYTALTLIVRISHRLAPI